jgi:monothiol glutaredoxin
MELENTTKENIEKMIGENEVFLFMKGNPDFPMCGFSSVASAILKKCGVNFGYYNVLDDEKIREGIKIFSNWPTIPQLYIQKEFVGGCDIMKEMAESGELIELFNTRGIKTEIS